MVETEPITVPIRADTTDLRTGLDQGRAAMKAFGDESKNASLKIRDTTDSSRALFTGLVNMRVASMATQRVMKELGINNEFVTRSFDAMNLVMDVAIALSAIYRAAKVAERSHRGWRRKRSSRRWPPTWACGPSGLARWWPLESPPPSSPPSVRSLTGSSAASSPRGSAEP